MKKTHTQWTLGLGLFGLLVGTLFVLAPAGSSQTVEPMRFGMNAGAISAQTSLGVKPDYATFWVGPWTLNSGWGGPDRELDQAYATGTTPAIQFYYWGDDISVDCVENGCDSDLHGARKDRAGWDLLATQLVDHLNAHMKGREAIIILETEFNKGGISTYEPFDGYLTEKARFIKAGYPAAKIVLGFGNWGANDWGTFDRAAAASDYTGIQGMRGSTRTSLSSYYALPQATLDGAKTLRAKFGKPILVTDIALSTYPEPEYLEHQRSVMASLMGRVGEFRAQGVAGIIYRSFYDNPNFDTKNYYGEAERHWGLSWPGTGGPKPALQAWVDGVKAARNQPAPSPSPTVASAPPASPMSYEAELFPTHTAGRAASDAAASGGAMWNLWANGYLETPVTARAAGLYDVTVWSRGNEAGGIRPHLVLSVDGRKVLEADPRAGAYQSFAATLPLTSGMHTVRIAFTNDAIVGGQDRNLIVDRVALGSVNRVEAEAFAVKTAGARQSDAQASGGARWNLWTNGHIDQSFAAAEDGVYALRVRVQGQSLAGVAPHMVMQVDGRRVGEADPTSGYRDVTVPVGTLAAGNHLVRIDFTNDALTSMGDRNLLLDRAELVRTG